MKTGGLDNPPEGRRQAGSSLPSESPAHAQGVGVSVGGVPLTVGVSGSVAVLEGVINMGSKVQVGALVRGGTGV